MTTSRIRVSMLAVLLVMLLAGGSAAARPAAPSVEPPVFLRAWGGEGEFLRRGQGVAVAADKTIFVSNTSVNRITRIDTNGRVTSWGELGLGPGQFELEPRGMALADDLIYVTDHGQRVHVFDRAGNVVRILTVPVDKFETEDVAVGGGKVFVLGDTPRTAIAMFDMTGNYLGQWGVIGSDTGQLLNPTGLAVDPTGGWVYAVDQDRKRILKFNSTGQFLGEFGSGGTGPGQLGGTNRAAVDSEGRLYVADAILDVVHVFDSQGNFLLRFNGSGSTVGPFQNPRGVFIARQSANDIYILDDFYVRRFVAARLFDNNSATEPFDRAWGREPAEFLRPLGMVYGRDDRLYVADRFILEAGGPFQGLVYSRHGTQLASWPISNGVVTGMSQDAAGAIYAVTPREHTVDKFVFNASLQATKVNTLGGEPGSDTAHFNAPSDVANDAAGNLYVADTANDRVQVFNSAGIYQRTIANPGLGPGQFTQPVSLALDAEGNLYLFERGGLRVLKFAPDGTYLTEWGGQGTEDGQFARPPTNGDLRYWTYPTLDVSDAGVFVTDPVLLRIQQFDHDGTFLTKWGSSGSGPGQFERDMDIALAPDGDIYVSDSGNNRIQVFSLTVPADDPAARLIKNGNLQADPALTGWAHSNARGRVLSTTRQPGPSGGGAYVMRIGEVVPVSQQAQKTAWASQVIYVHPSLTRPVLTFDYHLNVNDTIFFSWFQLDVMDALGVNSHQAVTFGYRSCDAPSPSAGQALGWRRAAHDLTPYRGQYVRLVFSIRNAWPTSKGIWAELDNVVVANAPAQTHRAFLPAASWTCKSP